MGLSSILTGEKKMKKKTVYLHHEMFKTSNDSIPLIWNHIISHLNLDNPTKSHPKEIVIYCNEYKEVIEEKVPKYHTP